MLPIPPHVQALWVLLDLSSKKSSGMVRSTSRPEEAEEEAPFDDSERILLSVLLVGAS